MRTLLRDPRVQRLLLANITGSIGSGVTIIAVPWLLIHRENGGQLYGWTTLVTTLALFLFMPYYGTWIDRHSRKTMLLVGELFGLGSTLVMAAWILLSGTVETWQLMFIFFSGMLYYTLHYPAKNAFLQQTFARTQYPQLMGLLEIQGQTAMMIAGGLGSVLIERVPLGLILLFDAGTYLVSFLIQSTLPYTATHLDASRPAPRTSVWVAMAEGWRWLHTRPQLTMFFACTLVPFTLVMVSNYLFPIYVADVLHASASVFGRGEIAFAFGAVLAGTMMPRLASSRGADRAIILAIGLCAASLAIVVLAPAQITYYCALLLFGFGNAGTRVARSTLLFAAVPVAVMGRVGMFFNVFDRALRTLLTMGMTLLVGHASAIAGFAVLLAVLLVAGVGVFASRHAVAKAAATEPALAA